MRHINEIKKLIQFPRTQIQLMFQKKTNSKKLFNSKLNIHHSTFKTQHSTFITQHSKLEVYMFSLIKVFLVITSTLVVLLTNLSCHRTPIEPEKTKVNLIYEDALCTEAYFRLKTTEINYPARVDLYLNKNKVNCFTTFSDDTVFVIENLLPKKNYTSYVRVYPEGGREIVSSEVSFVTMDTTSHNFTWQVFEFGNCGNSVLFDVAIIDENNIWAVGEIYMRDSLGRCDPNAYNAVHWDGNKWELKKIGNQGGWVCKTVFAFSATDIWFEGNIHWDGSSYKVYKNGWPLMPNGDGWRVNKLWGTSSNDLYAVGDYGNIAHWDGRRWTKIESGTDVDFNSIASGLNNEEVFVSGSSRNNSYHVLLKVNKDKRVEVQPPPQGKEGIYYVASANNVLFGDEISSGIYKRNLKYSNSYKFISRMDYKTYGMKADAYNNLFVVTSFSKIFHFNGMNLMSLNHPLSSVLAELRSVDVKNDLVVVVGDRIQNMFSGTAIVLIGKRNK